MNPDFYVIVDRRGIPADVVLYYDQAVLKARELSTKSNAHEVHPVYVMATVDKYLSVLIQERLHSDPAAGVGTDEYAEWAGKNPP